MAERSYRPVGQRVEALGKQGRDVETIGLVGGLPVFCIRAGRPRRLRVLLTGGVHGDEPAGVEAVLRFFEEDAEPWLAQVEFTALPCVNPVGYVRGTRGNGAGADINRSFESGGVPELEKRAAVHRVGLGAALRHWTGETGVPADQGIKQPVRKPTQEAEDYPLKSRPGP